MPKNINFFSVKTVVGCLIVLMGLVFVFYGVKKEAERVYTFKVEPVKVQGFSEMNEDKKDFPTQISIPELFIELPVRRAEVIDGYWEVFEDSAGWGSGSGVPGETGNQVIFAHARDGLFLPLLYVEKGMEITVSTQAETYVYEIMEIKEVYPNQIEVIQPTNTETLTLYTCSGFQDKKRLIVTARRN